MIVACTRCNTKYKIPEDKVSSGGVKVRCSKCKLTFFIKDNGQIEINPATTGTTSSPPSGIDFKGPPKIPQGYVQSGSKVPPLPKTPGKDVFPDLPPSLPINRPPSTNQPASPHKSLPPLPNQPSDTGLGVPEQDSDQDAPRDPFADIDLDDDFSLEHASKKIDSADSAVSHSTLDKSPLDSHKDPFADLKTGSEQPSGIETQKKVESAPVPTEPEKPWDESDPFSSVKVNGSEKTASGSESALEQSSGASNLRFSENDDFGPSGLELKGDTSRNIMQGGLYQPDILKDSTASMPEDPKPNRMPIKIEPKPNRLSIGVVKPVAANECKPVAANECKPVVDTVETRNVLWQVGIWAFLFVVGILLFVVYRSSGKPDFFSWSTYQQVFGDNNAHDRSVIGLEAKKISSTTYKNRLGRDLVVVWGEVTNTTSSKKRDVLVKGKILHKGGSVLSQAVAPAGVMFSPLEVYQMTDQNATMLAYRSKLPENAVIVINGGETVPFMLVFQKRPNLLKENKFLYDLEESKKPIRKNFTPDLVESKTE